MKNKFLATVILVIFSLVNVSSSYSYAANNEVKPIFTDSFEKKLNTQPTLKSTSYKQTINSSRGVSYVEGKTGYAVHLDSIDSYIGYSSSILNANKGTIRFNWKPDLNLYETYQNKQSKWQNYGQYTSPYYGGFLDVAGYKTAQKGAFAAGVSFNNQKDNKNTTLSFQTWDGASWVSANSTQVWAPNKWYDIAFSWSDATGKIKVYIDGKQVSETKYNTPLNKEECFFIGQGPWSFAGMEFWPYGPHSMIGTYDELKIYSDEYIGSDNSNSDNGINTPVENNTAAVKAMDLKGYANIPCSISKVSSSAGKIVNESRILTAEYGIKVTPSNSNNYSIDVTLPIEKSEVQFLSKNPSLSLEYFDSLTNTWDTAKSLIRLDKKSNSVQFNLIIGNRGIANNKVLLASNDFNNIVDSKFTTLLDNQNTYKVRIVSRWFSNQKIYQGKRFHIYYTNTYSSSKHKIKSDSEWNSTSGKAKKGDEFPDYIQDLEAALEETYDNLMSISKSEGNTFNALSFPQYVYVETLSGGSAGESPIGGSLKIASNNIKDWTDMKLSIAHEMVHVLQGKYYTTGKTGFVGNYLLGNRWFIEATAQYYGARAAKVTDKEKKAYYLDMSSNYLAVPITSDDELSYYTLGAFFEWLGDTYGKDIIAKALKKGGATDYNNLNSALKDKKSSMAIAFLDYNKYLLTHPQYVGGLNGSIRGALSNTSSLNKLSKGFFDDKTTFVKYEDSIEPLSSRYINIVGKNKKNALLVVDASESKIDSSWTKAYTYDFSSDFDADYKKNFELSITGTLINKKPLTVKNFGVSGAKRQIEQLITNADVFHVITSATAKVKENFYILVTPQIKSITKGSVAWSTDEIGNIPLSYISGYNVYRNGIKLNSSYIKPSKLNEILNFSNKDIVTGDKIQVQIVDKFGNSYPEITPVQPTKPPVVSTPVITSVSPSKMQKGGTIVITGKNFGNTKVAGSSVIYTKASDFIIITSWSNTRIEGKITNYLTTEQLKGELYVSVKGKSSNKYKIDLDTQGWRWNYDSQFYVGDTPETKSMFKLNGRNGGTFSYELPSKNEEDKKICNFNFTWEIPSTLNEANKTFPLKITVSDGGCEGKDVTFTAEISNKLTVGKITNSQNEIFLTAGGKLGSGNWKPSASKQTNIVCPISPSSNVWADIIISISINVNGQQRHIDIHNVYGHSK